MIDMCVFRLAVASGDRSEDEIRKIIDVYRLSLPLGISKTGNG